MAEKDVMKVYDGPDSNGNLLAEYTKGSIMPKDIISTQKAVYMELESRSITIGQGFKFQYKAGQ